jgi:hypothetical protein
MNNLLATPSYRSGAVRIADYIEFLALRGPHYRASQTDVIASFDRKEDEDEDVFEAPVVDAFSELTLRQQHLGRFARNYPFRLEGTSLVFRRSPTQQHLLYLFLLLATRLNMRDNRRHAGYDGAALFEEFSCEVARNFWSSTSTADKMVNAFVFGTARSALGKWDDENINVSSFKSAVNFLCQNLGEGGFFRPKTDGPVHAKDDRVDIVVWRRFSDGRAGQLIGFGQCKTGTHYKEELPRLRPEAFCRKWLDVMPATTPLGLFFVADRILGNLYDECADCGILFDRCRALDYAGRLPLQLKRACARWTEVALHKYRLG